MKNIILISVLTFLCLFTNVEAQAIKIDSLMSHSRIGVKTGLNFPGLSYSEPGLDDYKSSSLTRGIFGLFMETNYTYDLSFRPEMMLIGKGQKIEDKGISYKMKSTYFEFRFPVIYTYKRWPSIQPYALFGPTLSFSTGGKITLNNYSININKSNIAPVDFGLVVGFGVKSPVNLKDIPFTISGEIAYSHGFVNTYAKDEKDGSSTAVNNGSYTINGTRLNRGLEVTVAVAIPLTSLSLLFRKKRQTVVPIHREGASVVVELKEEPKRNCYSIEEILEYINQGQDVKNKKICMYNINFETGKSIIDKSSLPYLNQIVTLLNGYPLIKIKVNGHTDNIGTEDHNVQLSMNRAQTVYNYLLENRIAADRLSYAFFGTRYPIAPNDTEVGRSQNRRVEFEITTGAK